MSPPRPGRDHGPILPPATLGVIGGGQLGRMFLQAAQRLGYRTVVLSPIADGPAAQVAHRSIVAPPEKLSALAELADVADAVTVEFENVPAPGLRWLSRRLPTRPGWRTVWTCQDRAREKGFLARHGLPVTPWRAIREDADLAAVDRFPVILKTSSSGYDGKGQVRVPSPEDLPSAWASLGRVASVAEEVVDFEAELSVVVARGADGAAAAYPVAWNRHDRHILDTTVMPAPVGPIVAQEARDLAVAAAEALGTVGILTVEFFLKVDGSLVVNEMAPRPHNSGHLTIEAASTCQFEQQVRALCGLPLGSTDLAMPAAMVNLLGDLWVDGVPAWAEALGLDPGAKLHLYGKRTAAPGRKMGHLTVLDPDPRRALARALAARRALARR